MEQNTTTSKKSRVLKIYVQQKMPVTTKQKKYLKKSAKPTEVLMISN